MANRNIVVSVVALFALLAVVMAVVSVKMSPLDQSDAAFVVEDAYLRTSMPTSQAGAAFMTLTNRTGTDDRLLGARADIADRVELHTHDQDADGVMRMSRIEGGIALPDGSEHRLARGGDHLMFLGLSRPLVQGEIIPVTLDFEAAGDVLIQIPVDLER